MSYLSDSRQPGGPGIFILQHNNHLRQGYSTDMRAGMLGVRITERLEKLPNLGRYVYDQITAGDITQSFVWLKNTRPVSGWSWAWPVVITDTGNNSVATGQKYQAGIDLNLINGPVGSPVPTGAGGKSGSDCPTARPELMIPLMNGDVKPDFSFSTIKPFFPETKGKREWPRFARGFYGIGQVGTNTDQQIEYFMPTDPRMVAVNFTGDPEIGSWVCDLDKEHKIDLERTARLQSMMWVVKKPTGCPAFNRQNSIAWNIGPSGCRDVYGGLVIDDAVDIRVGTGDDRDTAKVLAHVSTSHGGPFDVGNSTDQHIVGHDFDGHQINALHINTAAYFRMDNSRDGPIDFEPSGILADEGDGKVVKVHIGYVPLPHKFPCAGGKIGKWVLWTRQKVYTVTDNDPPSEPWGNPVPPGWGNGNGGGGGGGGNPGGGGGGNPPNPPWTFGPISVVPIDYYTDELYDGFEVGTGKFDPVDKDPDKKKQEPNSRGLLPGGGVWPPPENPDKKAPPAFPNQPGRGLLPGMGTWPPNVDPDKPVQPPKKTPGARNFIWGIWPPNVDPNLPKKKRGPILGGYVIPLGSGPKGPAGVPVTINGAEVAEEVKKFLDLYTGTLTADQLIKLILETGDKANALQGELLTWSGGKGQPTIVDKIKRADYEELMKRWAVIIAIFQALQYNYKELLKSAHEVEKYNQERGFFASPWVKPWSPELGQKKASAIITETAFPAILGRPQRISSAEIDLRNNIYPLEKASKYHDHIAPIVARMEAFGNQNANTYDYTQKPMQGKYVGGTSSGGFVYMPPELDMADQPNFTPTNRTLSTSYVAALSGGNTFFASGKPSMSTGSIISGHRWADDSTGNLVFESLDASSATVATLKLTDSDLVQFGNGTSGTWSNAVGVLGRTLTAAGTDADLLEKTLATVTITGNTLNINGQGVRVKAWGTTAANGNAKTIRLKFGATTIATNDITKSPNGLAWECDADIFRTAATAQESIGASYVGAVAQSKSDTQPRETETGNIDITLTGQNGVATANDIVCNGMIV